MMDKQALDRWITGNWGEDSVPEHDPDGDYCACDDCYAARDEQRGKEEENELWYVHEVCPSCGRNVEPVETRNECECGFRPWPGIGDWDA